MKTRRAIKLILGLRSERAAAIVEFALVVPFLMLMMCATIDFGLAVYTLNNLTAAAREGGRFGATLDYTSETADSTAVATRVFNYIHYINGQPLTDAQLHGFISVTLPVPFAAGVPANGGNVTVRITGYPYRPVTPLAAAFGLSQITLNRTATFRWERSS
jgi:Flp pilus assembly protein TadG